MSAVAAISPSLIEQYLPEYNFRHRYDIVVNSGDIDTVYEIAQDVDLGKSAVVPLLFKLRGLPTARLNAKAFFAAMGWTLLAERRPHEFLIGYWRDDRIRPVTDLEHFLHATSGVRQKVIFSLRFEQLSARQVRVETETRVLCLGEDEVRRFRLYWLAIRPFSGLVRTEVLRLIKNEAEERARR